MIFIKKDDFSIWDDGELEGDDIDLYFEVDESIAPAIQVLNRKGYQTLFCCCGHPYPSHGEAWLPLTIEDPFHVVCGTYEAIPEPDDDSHFEGGQYHIRFINEPSTCSYISFAEGIVLPHLPDGWVMEDDPSRVVMNYFYDDELEGFKYMRERQRVMEKLYEWAESLPDTRREKEFSDEDLSKAARAVRDTMLQSLEEPKNE